MVNHQLLADKGKFVTSRQLRDRLTGTADQHGTARP
jgi:hypothetical protein